MDYSAMTTSDVEWRAAVCLCGSPFCRGSFLHFATQDDLQQVLNLNCGSLIRFASLLRACGSRMFSAQDQATLDRHGMGEVVLGGSFTRPVAAAAGDTFHADYGPLGNIAFRFV